MNQISKECYHIPRILNSTPVATLIVAVLYATVAQAGFMTITMPGNINIAPIFPSAGIALAAIILLGTRAFWGVWLGSFAGNMISSFLDQGHFPLSLESFAIKAIIASGAAIGAVAGAFLVRRFSSKLFSLDRAQNILALFLAGALGATMVSPTIRVLTLSIVGAIPWKVAHYAWLTWWIGDAGGAAVITPLILAWFQKHSSHLTPRRILEAIILGGMTLLLCYFVFFRSVPLEYSIIPLLFWAAFRFDVRGTSTVAAFVAVLATISTAHGIGPFVKGTVNESLLFLESFLGIIVIWPLFLAGALAEQKQAEAERKKLISELEARNTELTQFTYTVSHELKSPVVTIKGFIGSVKQDLNNRKFERAEKDMDRVAAAADKMHETISDLLELSRIGRLTNAPKDIPFEDLVRDAMDAVHGQLEERQVTVHSQPDLPIVHGDRQRLVEVLQNLIGNAIKFMGDQPNPLIEIGQRGEDAERGELVFYVKDNGIGIAPEHHERIFGLFNQLNPKMGGTGVGLALVRRIIEVHGGRIWIQSEVGKGSTFYFTIPLSNTHHPINN